MFCWLLVGIAVLAFFYWGMNRRYKYWTARGVKQGNPRFLLGDNGGTFFGSQTMAEMVQYVYNQVPNVRYSGMYQLFIPTLLLKDPDLIKQVTVKDFDYFVDRRNLVSEDSDLLWSKNLFALSGQKWRDMRSTLSPAFTSSKMKQMFTLITESAEEFTKYFLKKDEELITIEMKDIFTRFTNDVIGSTAFGVKCDSLEERNNEFFLMGKEATEITGIWQHIKLFAIFFVPGISKYVKLGVFSQNVRNFFITLTKNTITTREKQGVIRPDMINLLLEARKHGLKHEESHPDEDTGFATVQESEIGKSKSLNKVEITDLDIAAQALIFFFGGFDSVSSLMCFMSHELGVNPDIQERLRKEVDKINKECRGKLTYEALLRMKYMDMVTSETLRKWPNGVAVDRICTKPYTIEPVNPDEKPVHLEKGTVLWLPIYALHHDPQYFPDPDRFDPERFNDDNKGNIRPYTYIPFGSGPRNCIGCRFALLETKAIFFYILTNFQIVPVEKTQIPLKLSKKGFGILAEKGFWLGLKRRVK